MLIYIGFIYLRLLLEEIKCFFGGLGTFWLQFTLQANANFAKFRVRTINFHFLVFLDFVNIQNMALAVLKIYEQRAITVTLE